MQTIHSNQRASCAIPSALVCHQLFLEDGCSLLQKVNLEKRPCMRKGESGSNVSTACMVQQNIRFRQFFP